MGGNRVFGQSSKNLFEPFLCSSSSCSYFITLRVLLYQESVWECFFFPLYPSFSYHNWCGIWSQHPPLAYRYRFLLSLWCRQIPRYQSQVKMQNKQMLVWVYAVSISHVPIYAAKRNRGVSVPRHLFRGQKIFSGKKQLHI